ncbi:VPS35 endosomal protein sorting factor-like isoform X4 [Schistocerca gregaria]|uniref:VPS35 endosomal protein sorting factor-like isoform X4 n=1 Tax=Schistocerca gregaria TaxID=7010 RepID=UPI00211DED0E|nr:VPS35 endosomal protein sorting factor-like isoform X4 [Schistocerca gregaria]
MTIEKTVSKIATVAVTGRKSKLRVQLLASLRMLYRIRILFILVLLSPRTEVTQPPISPLAHNPPLFPCRFLEADTSASSYSDENSGQADNLGLSIAIARGKIYKQTNAFDKVIQNDWIAEKNFSYVEPLQTLLGSLDDTIDAVQIYPLRWSLITSSVDKFAKIFVEYVEQLDSTTPMKQSRKIVSQHCSKIKCFKKPISRTYAELLCLICSKTPFGNSSYFSYLARNIVIAADPVAGIHALNFLVQKTFEFEPKAGNNSEIIFQVFQVLQGIFSSSHVAYLKQRALTYSQFLGIISPALNCVFGYIGPYATDLLLIETLLENCVGQAVGSLLHVLVSTTLVSLNLPFFLKVIQEYDDVYVPRTQVYRVLLASLLNRPDKAMDSDDPRMLAIWARVSRLPDIGDLLCIAEDLLDYFLDGINSELISSVLEMVVSRLASATDLTKIQPHLKRILDKILACSVDLVSAYDEKYFLSILKYSSLSVGKPLAAALLRTKRPIRSPVVIESVFDALLNHVRSFDVFTIEDQLKEATQLVTEFIGKVDFGQEFEKYLEFAVKCRGAFIDLHQTKSVIVQKTLNVLVELNRYNSQHSKKTTSLVLAFVAFCRTAIAPISDFNKKIRLYLLAGQIALASQAVALAESLFQAITDALAELCTQQQNSEMVSVSLSTQYYNTGNSPVVEVHLVDFLHQFIGVLVSISGHPTLGPCYQLRKLYDAVELYSLQSKNFPKAGLFISMIKCLSLYMNSPSSCSFDHADEPTCVDSVEHKDEIRAFINELMFKILEQIQPPVPSESKRAQIEVNKIRLDLLNAVLGFAKSSPELSSLVSALYSTISETEHDAHYLKNTLNWARHNPQAGNRDRLFHLLKQC